ncbi:MAG: hypothetical protein B7Y69_08710 [Sphingobacteriia bacterium 35-40-8]|nr:MAG: hypothetical protein B7Y69_08710 [Sphingobacteriia bacterium 35-40-8]OZA68561.1 MAG: hypothetical protein B7X72_01595 [Sphingobacteriia bacterium 39-39-8]HQR93166.1 Ig-like domain-containing protein [Sediminibacterium sp.]
MVVIFAAMIHWNLKNTGIALLIVVGQMLLFSCANIIPPGGGPRDTIAPRLIMANPKDSSKNVISQNITLTFDEYVELQGVNENLVIQPYPKNTPLVDYKLRNVTVKLKDSLEKNTTYAINFGNSIKDVNEGNLAKELTYVFSTGNQIDGNQYQGTVMLAETGKTDSNFIVVLHNILEDSSIKKNRPRYMTKLDGKGNFRFKYLPDGRFNVFVLPNDFTKKYDDSTKIFGFLNAPILINGNPRTDTLYAYQEYKKIDKPSTSSNNNNAKLNERKTEDKRLKYKASLDNGQQDLLNPLVLTFNRKIKQWDSSKIRFMDTLYQPITGYKISMDSTQTKFSIQYPWREKTSFRIIIAKDAFSDTAGLNLPKADSARFVTKREAEYGSFRLRFTNLDLSKHPVLQLIQENKLVESIPLTSPDYIRKRYRPGEYELRILLDQNQNGVWDPGNYLKKLQPELVRAYTKKMVIRADRDTDLRYTF